jgi:hypothetical protein
VPGLSGPEWIRCVGAVVIIADPINFSLPGK